MLLKGLRVVDLSRVLAGPFCGQLLADMGADVIKVESSAGDENRLWPPIMPSGQSSNYGSVNRGKRAMTLDMKSEGGQRILNQMIRRADVVTHSFLPDVRAPSRYAIQGRGFGTAPLNGLPHAWRAHRRDTIGAGLRLFRDRAVSTIKGSLNR